VKIFTSRFSYRELGSSGLVKISIASRPPRSRVGYRVISYRRLMPDNIELGDRFDWRYLARLEMYGVELISDELRGLSGGGDSVLLCNENVVAGETCHRRLFAEWWAEKTGEEVMELEDVVAGVQEVLF